MDISRDYIVIYNKKLGKDEYKLNIERIHLNSNGIYEVKYIGNTQVYPAKPDDVFWVKWENAIRHNPLNIKAYTQSTELNNIKEIYSFRDKGKEHWRIMFSNGTERNYLQGSILVVESCLSDDVAKNSFEYLKLVAHANNLGKDENEEDKGILERRY